MTEVILVSEADEAIGTLDKLAAHRPPARLHRAFSVFLIDDRGAVLLQRRALGKYHFAGLWANACCGHPQPGESTLVAAERRTFEELRVRPRELRELGQVRYRADDPASGLAEHELDHVLLGRLSSVAQPDPVEVAETQLVSRTELSDWLDRDPTAFAPWVALIWPLVVAELSA